MRYMLLVAIALLAGPALPAQPDNIYDGTRAIHELRDGWLILRLPAFEKKLATIDSLLGMDDLSDGARERLEREKQRTIGERGIIQEWYPVFFDSLYTFSHWGYISMHETEPFRRGEIVPRTSQGPVPDSIHREEYFFATLQGAVGKPVQFTTKDGRIVAFPFPNNVAKPGIVLAPLFAPALPVWATSSGEYRNTIHRAFLHVLRINRKLHRFHGRKAAMLYQPEE